MTMRAVVERNSASGTDTYGHPVAPVFAAHATLPCFVWSSQRREVVDGDKTATVEDLRAVFPLGADILEADEIASVTDRQGSEILSGRARIDALQRKHRHLEAALVKVT
jgi:hypothetical protein